MQLSIRSYLEQVILYRANDIYIISEPSLEEMVEIVQKSSFFVAINGHIAGKYSPKVSMLNSQ